MDGLFCMDLFSGLSPLGLAALYRLNRLVLLELVCRLTGSGDVIPLTPLLFHMVR